MDVRHIECWIWNSIKCDEHCPFNNLYIRSTVMTEPDFRCWSENLITLILDQGKAQKTLETALKDSYNQGYQLGLNFGWCIEQDKEHR